QDEDRSLPGNFTFFPLERDAIELNLPKQGGFTRSPPTLKLLSVNHEGVAIQVKSDDRILRENETFYLDRVLLRVWMEFNSPWANPLRNRQTVLSPGNPKPVTRPNCMSHQRS